MKTPTGRECKHYYEDYFRGRSVQECRLAKLNPNSLSWRPSDCGKCPVPDILNANASPNMELTLTISKGMLGFGRKITISAHCLKHDIPIPDPYVGCPQEVQESSGLDLFRRALEDDERD